MALRSRFGLWRLTALVNSLTYKGPMKVADFASFAQFDPSWEREVRREVQALEGRLFLDVGANIGYYSVLAASRGNKVIAVEPDRKAFGILQENTRRWGVECYNYAAWSHDTVIGFKTGRHSDTGRVDSSSPVHAKAVPLDLVLDGRIPALIKIDAEGSEPQILDGLYQTLQMRPKVIFEALSREKLRQCVQRLPDYDFLQLDRTNYLAS